MPTDLFSVLLGAAGAPTVWRAIPEGVKNRCGQGFDRLTGKLTRKWDRENRKDDAEIDNAIKRDGNNLDVRKQVLQALIPEMSEAISADPALMKRALIETMGEAYLKQKNKDAVAQEAIIDVADKYEDSSSSDEKIDEDWLNIFSAYAEKASSTRTQQLWGKILSGEIRSPGKFSLSTLRVLSELDQVTAQNFVKFANIIFDGRIFLPEKDKEKSFSDLLLMQNSGIIAGVDTMLAANVRKTSGGYYTMVDNELFIKINSDKNDTIIFDSINLTKAGHELSNMIELKKDIDAKISNIYRFLIEKHMVKSFDIFKVVNKYENKVDHSLDPLKSWSR